MKYLYIYLLVGLVFACVFRDHDDRRVISHPMLTLVFVVVYPFLLWYFAFRINYIKYKGKVIWKRKRK